MSAHVEVVPDPERLFRAAAEAFTRSAEEAVGARGSFSVALSGGSTPRGLYSVLASDSALRARTPWEKIQFFWGDERHVPPDHAESNFRMANETLLSKVPVPAGNVHRILGEQQDAGQAAAQYEHELRESFRLSADAFPSFDLVLLGMGPDGHTASLFPGTKALDEARRIVVSNWVGKFYTHRITMTPPVLNAAGHVIFLVQGEDKAPALKAVLEGPFEPEQLPAQLIRPKNGRLLWLVDQAAARLLATARHKEKP